MGVASISRALTEEFAARWLAAHPDGRIVERDLASTAIPPIDAAWIAANYTPKPERTAEQHELLAVSTRLTAELLAADAVVAGVPMHNWGPPAIFKLWADQIVRFGETLAITPDGLRGTLAHQRITCIVTAGRHFAAHARRDHVGPWLRTFFGHLGADIATVFVDGTADVRHRRIERDAFVERHRPTIDALVT